MQYCNQNLSIEIKIYIDVDCYVDVYGIYFCYFKVNKKFGFILFSSRVQLQFSVIILLLFC